MMNKIRPQQVQRSSANLMEILFVQDDKQYL